MLAFFFMLYHKVHASIHACELLILSGGNELKDLALSCTFLGSPGHFKVSFGAWLKSVIDLLIISFWLLKDCIEIN